MTVAAHRPRAPVADLDGALAALRDDGHRVSAARRALLEALFEADGPQSAERLGRAAGADADLASVYRNLELFERLGLVRHVHLGHGPGLYATGPWADREFLVCERCGRVRSVDPRELDELRDAVERRFGFRVDFAHFPLTGLCASCAAADGEGGAHAHGHGEHSHEHSHGDLVHSHPHDHAHGDEHSHRHDHDASGA